MRVSDKYPHLATHSRVVDVQGAQAPGLCTDAGSALAESDGAQGLQSLGHGRDKSKGDTQRAGS